MRFIPTSTGKHTYTHLSYREPLPESPQGCWVLMQELHAVTEPHRKSQCLGIYHFLQPRAQKRGYWSAPQLGDAAPVTSCLLSVCPGDSCLRPSLSSLLPPRHLVPARTGSVAGVCGTASHPDSLSGWHSYKGCQPCNTQQQRGEVDR